MGAEIHTHPFVNQAQQFQWALDNIELAGDWILRLDADEIIEEALVDEIAQKLPLIPLEITGINLKRKHIFMGRWIKFGGRYPLLMLRIFRRGLGQVEDRWMDEHIIVKSGSTVTFKNSFADINLNDLSYFTQKHNKYATREAIEVLNQKYNLFDLQKSPTISNSSFRTVLKRFIKENLYNKIPFTISTLIYFLWRYIFLLGFLDGRQGLIYHFLQGYWYRFLVGAKVQEFEDAIAHMDTNSEIISKISVLSGHDLSKRNQL